MLVENINWLLIFPHSQFRCESKLRKSKVKKQKITALTLDKGKVLLVFTNTLRETVFTPKKKKKSFFFKNTVNIDY